MKLIGSFAGAALATVVLVIVEPAEAQVTLRIEAPLPAAQPTSMSMHIFKDEVERRSAGSIEVEIVADSQRGLSETIDAVHLGTIFGTWLSVGNFSRLVPEIEAVSLPFVFDNYDEARRGVVESPIGALITKKLDAKGFTVLAWMDLGAFNVSNSKRPLKGLDDFKGLTIRVLPNATHIATFRALGAHPVAMDFRDVDAALRQGDIDGQEQEYTILYANKSFESQKYLSDTAHFLDFYILVVNKRAFANLDPTQQTTVREAAAIMSFRQHKISADAMTAALIQLQGKGMQFDPLTSETRAALRRATASVVDGVKKGVGADLVNMVLAAKTSGESKQDARVRQGFDPPGPSSPEVRAR